MTSPPVAPSILEQHLEDAPFLWTQREAAARSPGCALPGLVRLDERLDANLDGLVEAGDAAWAISEEAIASGSEGDVFRAAFLALCSDEPSRFAMVLGTTPGSGELQRPIIAALAWLPFLRVQGPLDRLLRSGEEALARLGLAGYLAHRRDPGRLLDLGAESPNALLRARALRGFGEMGRQNTRAVLAEALRAPEEPCRFEATFAGCLLHAKGPWLDVLETFIAPDSPRSARALELWVSRRGPAAARAMVQDLRRRQAMRLAIVAAGISGDAAEVPWLIEAMELPEHARLAAAAFTRITGADLGTEKLKDLQPPDTGEGPNDDPEDEQVQPGPDDALPWPAPAAVRSWWEARSSQWKPGIRLLLGAPVTPEWCRQVLAFASQPHRLAAALELAMSRPGMPLFEVRAPGFRQKATLDSLP